MGIKADTLRVAKWLRRGLCNYAQHHVILSEEPATAIEILADTPSPRPLGYLLNPIIAHALLGPLKDHQRKYPPLSTAQVFGLNGYKFNPHAIAKEFRRTLFDGTVQIKKRDVYRGEGES